MNRAARRLALGAAAVALAAGPLAIGCALPEPKSFFPPSLEIYPRQIEIAPAELHGLRLRGAVSLTSNHPAFGGLSGMLIAGGEMIAVTDRGWLLRSPLADDEGGLRPVGGDIVRLRDRAGVRLGEGAKDAEGLAVLGARLAVSFEHDHRVGIVDGDRIVATLRDRRFERLGSNEGLEALATLPDGRLLAIAEAPEGEAFPLFLVDAEGGIAEAALPRAGRHFVTGADVGPDGRLYLAKRDYSPIRGVSIRVERYWLGPDGLPRTETREVLAALEGASGIDNMEAIALWRDAGGRLRLTLLADDNFNPVQRTLLVDFEVLD